MYTLEECIFCCCLVSLAFDMLYLRISVCGKVRFSFRRKAKVRNLLVQRGWRSQECEEENLEQQNNLNYTLS